MLIRVFILSGWETWRRSRACTSSSLAWRDSWRQGRALGATGCFATYRRLGEVIRPESSRVCTVWPRRRARCFGLLLRLQPLCLLALFLPLSITGVDRATAPTSGQPLGRSCRTADARRSRSHSCKPLGSMMSWRWSKGVGISKAGKGCTLMVSLLLVGILLLARCDAFEIRLPIFAGDLLIASRVPPALGKTFHLVHDVGADDSEPTRGAAAPRSESKEMRIQLEGWPRARVG